MKIPIRVLLVEDNPADTELVLRQLRHGGFDPDWQRVDTEEEFRAKLRPELDIILSDFAMPQFTGLHALEILQESELEIPFILISGTIGEDTAVAAMQRGATDYLLKDRLLRLAAAVTRALADARVLRERHRVEAALRESEKRFSESAKTQIAILNAVPAHIALLDPEGRIVAVNEAWRRFAAANVLQGPASAVGQNYLEICERAYGDCAEEAENAAAGIRRVLRGELPEYALEYPCHSPVEERWYRLMVSPLGEGVRGGAVVMHINITERRATEESLRLFRNLVDQSNDTFEVIDPETGRFLDVNAKGPAELGCSREEYLARRVTDLDPRMTPPVWEQFVKDIRAQGSWSGEGRHRRMDGTTFPTEFNSKWVRLDRDYIVTVVRDVTARRQSEARFRRLVESNAQGVMFFHTTGATTDANDTFLRLVDYAREDLEARRVGWKDLTPPEYSDLDRHALQELAERGVCAPYEKEFLRRDGSRVPVLVGAAIFEDSPEEGVCFVVDLTEPKKIEQQFLRAQRMESIGTLAGGIAHDLNNALGPIIMSLELLQMKFTDRASQDLISIIGSSAQRGADMVQQVLSFARGVEGRRMEVQVGHLLKEVGKIANDTFLKHIRVRMIIPHDLWRVQGDPTQLHQVILNLCVNARDAMAEGGTLTLSAQNLTFDAQYVGLNLEAKVGPYVFLQVEDTGTGIPPGVLEKIFDPFFTTKELGKGTGLGLSTSLGIVKSHGGFIRVESELGKGTKFKVYLPAQLGTAPGGAEQIAEMPPGHGELILVVDDESAVRQITQQTLEVFGYRVILAGDGAEAVGIFARRQAEIAVVLTDMMMPVMDGPATIQILRKMNPAVQIIAASGLSTPGHTAQAAGLGVKYFLPKPYTAETLLKTLQQILVKER